MLVTHRDQKVKVEKTLLSITVKHCLPVVDILSFRDNTSNTTKNSKEAIC